MKTPKILFLALIFALNSCSSDENNTETPDSTSKFAMTAKVDGTLWEMQNPFSSDYTTKPLFDYYPQTEFIQLQGRKTLIDEIRIYIKRSNLKIGTYPITAASYDASKTQIEMSYNSKGTNIQYPVEGSVIITAVDTNAKTVKGTFSFNCVENSSKPISASNPITTKVTDGTFSYRYDVSN
ncbi:hypothetical protein EYY60_05725 [Flavobacterium zhairuonense]|uniref:DUF6252 family protein n=1 Tax=Flavobacterium zhairuonense TaxID=2493631 RepID=UPI00104D5009|nr:DUF6252 family protein [Flavobacterium zhairuonense]KAF2513726.1 hypothetical protein EYY60_05725 [Flavobacterium zhairuonense]